MDLYLKKQIGPQLEAVRRIQYTLTDQILYFRQAPMND
jgi:hypothetical protein